MTSNKNMRDFLVKNFAMVLTYSIIYIILFFWKKSTYIHQPNFSLSNVRIFQSIMIPLIELLFILGFTLLFKEFYEVNSTDFYIICIFYSFLAIPLLSPIIHPFSGELLSVFLGIGGSLFLFLGNLAIYIHNERFQVLSNILKQKSFKNYMVWLKTNKIPDITLKKRLITTNVLWGISTIISVFFLFYDNDLIQIGVLLIVISNLFFSSIFGLYKGNKLKVNLLKLTLTIILTSIVVFYSIQSLWNYDPFTSDSISVIHACISAIILLLFQTIVNQLFKEEHLIDPEHFSPWILKNMGIHEKISDQKLVIIGLSLIFAAFISFMTTGVVDLMLINNWNYWPGIFAIINSMLSALIFNLAIRNNTKKHSKLIIMLKFGIFFGLFFGIHFFYLYLAISFGDNVYLFIFVIYFCCSFLYLVIALLKSRKIPSPNKNAAKLPEHLCPSCKIHLEPEIISALKEQTFVFCKFCGEKIRYPQIFEITEHDLIEEHQKMLEKINQPSESSNLSLSTNNV